MAYLSSAYQTTSTIGLPLTVEGQQGAFAEFDFQQAVEALLQLHREHSPLLQLPERMEDLEEMDAHALRIRRQSDRLVLVGIGGSSLGARALASVADKADPLRFHILDNPDPTSIDALLADCDPMGTSWLFVSKSGGTIESLSQIIVILQRLEQHIGLNEVAQRCVAITELKDSPLIRLAAHYRMPVLQHEELGGRWACFSNIGLLAAACCGVDIRQCRAGANAVAQHALAADIADNQILQGALFGASQYRAGRHIHVMMPYGDRLDFVPWYAQLVSESLGKEGKGITPLTARGAVDQHSMLQLMLDGPDDKFFTVVAAPHAGKGARIHGDLARLCGLEYLADQPIGNVLEAFQEATIGSFKAAGRPVRVIRLPEIDAYHLGALLMYCMLETLYMAELLEVDPFTQPAVEDSKVRAQFILRNPR